MEWLVVNSLTDDFMGAFRSDYQFRLILWRLGQWVGDESVAAFLADTRLCSSEAPEF